MKNIKELYDKYMSVTQATDTPLEVVLDISSTFWDDLHHDGVSLSIKQQIARNWQLKNRCNKEKDLLKDDMLNFLSFETRQISLDLLLNIVFCFLEYIALHKRNWLA